MAGDEIDAVLSRLSAESRALLELSVRRGIPDEEIASLLGTTESGVRLRREAVMHEIADSLHQRPGAALRRRVAEHLGGRGNLFAPAPDSQDGDAPEPERRSRAWLPALLGVLVIAVAVALVLALSGGGDNDKGEPGGRRTAQLGPEARLEPLPGGPKADAMARLVRRDHRDRLQLHVSGLPRPRGSYTVWLYDSVAKAERLGSSSTGTIDLDAALPADVDRYSDIDISVEPNDGNPNHSGASILRVPLARLLP